MKRLLNSLILLFVSAVAVFAQPANDEPCNATTLPVNGPCTFQTYNGAGATLTGTPSLAGTCFNTGLCFGGASAPSGDVWFTFNVNTVDPIYVNTASIAGGMTNPVMYVYVGDVCAGAGTLLACVADGASGNPYPDYVISGYPIGTPIYIRISDQVTGIFSCSTTGMGNFQLCAATTVCGNVPMPGQTCASATPICDLNGYCGRTTGYTVNTWGALTTGFSCGSIENNSFLSFVAAGATVNLSVNVTGCSNGDGIQFMLFTTTGCGSGSVSSLFCSGQMWPGVNPISFTGLTAGQTYLLMIDGFAGDVCDYSISIGGGGGILLPVDAGPNINLCGAGQNITLTASGGMGPYTWTDSQGNTVGTGVSITVNPTVTETYTVTGSAGNPLCPNSASDDVTVTVVPNTFQLNVQPTDTTVCQGQSITIAASGATSYVWTPAIGLSDSTGASVTASPGTSQVYTVTGTLNGCSLSATATLNINPTPALPTITSNTPVCEGENITLTGTAGAGSAYHWSGPSSFNSSAASPVITGATPAQGGNYSLYVVAGGCTSATQTHAVTVNPLPATPIFSTNSPLCEGATLTLNGPTVAGATYTWAGPGAWNASVEDPQVGSVTTAASGSYSLYVVVNNCTSGTQSQLVAVNPLPTVTYNGPTQVCGTQALLSATAQVATGGISNYLWTYNAGGIGMGQTLPYNFPVSPATTVSGMVTAITQAGCADSANFSIALQVVPQADFDFSPPCSGLTVNFTDQSTWNGTPGAATFSHNWNFGDGQHDAAASPQHIYAQNGTYQVTVEVGSSASPCKDTLTQEVKVSSLPDASFAYEEKCFQNVSFQSTSTAPGSSIVDFDWDLDDGGSSSDSLLMHEYDQPGTYQVTLTVVSAETCTSSVTMNVTVNPSTKLSELKLPNVITPGSDGMNDALTFDQGMDGCNEYEMAIFNRWGSMIYKQRKGSEPFRGLSQSGSRLSPGVYFYTIKADELQLNGTITILY